MIHLPPPNEVTRVVFWQLEEIGDVHDLRFAVYRELAVGWAYVGGQRYHDAVAHAWAQFIFREDQPFNLRILS